MNELENIVTDLLVSLEHVLPQHPTVDVLTTSAYVKVLEFHGIEPRHVEQAAMQILSREKFWPAPAVVLEYCQAAKAAEEALREQERLKNLVMVTDSNGYKVMMPREKARQLADKGLVLCEEVLEFGGNLPETARLSPSPISEGVGEETRALNGQNGADWYETGTPDGTDATSLLVVQGGEE